MAKSEEPGRGELAIRVRPPQVLGSPRRFFGASLLVLSVLLIGLTYWFNLNPVHSTTRSVDHAVHQLNLSSPPTATRPAGSYAAFTWHSRSSHKEQSYIFKEELLEIRSVKSEREIPAEDLVDAIKPRRPGAAVRVQPLAGALLPAPFIFHGDIDIAAGPLKDLDRWIANYGTVGGEVTVSRSEYWGTDAGLLRGPPRTIYVVGKIRSIKTPDTLGRSKSSVSIVQLDLRPNEEDFRAYMDRVAMELALKQQIEKMERSIQEAREVLEPGELTRDGIRDKPWEGVELPKEAPIALP